MNSRSEDSFVSKLAVPKPRPIGAWFEKDLLRFRLWAPFAKSVDLVWIAGTEKNYFPMEKEERGYYDIAAPKQTDQARYMFRLDGNLEIPDPASRFQPEGPLGPSQISKFEFSWTDREWKVPTFEELVIYELHVGTFSEAGTFAGVIEHLEHLKDLGISAIEIMPVGQFSGARNWGYDGVGIFAVQNSYGDKDESPLAFKKLIDTCHQMGIAVILDVVYNHLGPEGNFLPKLGPYFQDKYRTPWGDALNYDGVWSDEVRNYFFENIRQWLEDFHIDGLRLDAVHAIFDTSATPFLEQIARYTRSLEEKWGRRFYLIAESESNDSRILRSLDERGLGLDAQWADDRHHVVHTLLTGENQGYYGDYGMIEQLAEIYKRGLLYEGQYSPTRHRSHGRSYKDIEKNRLVVCSQNHDQIGNRKMGERLIKLVGPQKQKLAAACMFLSPSLPLIFMGEEFAEMAPFLYFVDHTDEDLLEAVRKGREKEFAAFGWDGKVPDPGSSETFLQSKLDWKKGQSALAEEFKEYYRQLISLSKWIRRMRFFETGVVDIHTYSDEKVLKIDVTKEETSLLIFLSFSSKPQLLPFSKLIDIKTVLNSVEKEYVSNDKCNFDQGIQIPPFAAVALTARKVVQ